VQGRGKLIKKGEGLATQEAFSAKKKEKRKAREDVIEEERQCREIDARAEGPGRKPKETNKKGVTVENTPGTGKLRGPPRKKGVCGY